MQSLLEDTTVFSINAETNKNNDNNILDSIYESRKATNPKDSLFKFIDLKDPKLAQHCMAVAAYSYAISVAMDIKEWQRIKLWDAAKLHDIGKIMVDSAVLNKKDTLEDREFLQIKCHSERGMRMLSFFHMNDVIVDAAWHHHERWDGNGYPDGIKGKNIEFLTRIISVADSIDAMAENRPYRRHLNDQEILDQLEIAKGSQLDPNITEVAIELIKKEKLKAYLV